MKPPQGYVTTATAARLLGFKSTQGARRFLRTVMPSSEMKSKHNTKMFIWDRAVVLTMKEEGAGRPYARRLHTRHDVPVASDECPVCAKEAAQQIGEAMKPADAAPEMTEGVKYKIPLPEKVKGTALPARLRGLADAIDAGWLTEQDVRLLLRENHS